MYNYKITFHLASSVSFIDMPMFDGIIAWAYLKDKYGHVPQRLTNEQQYDFSRLLPFDYHPDGWAYASWAIWDAEQSVEFTGSWKKRWDNQHDHLADFGKTRTGKAKPRFLRTASGMYKSYDVPLVLHDIDRLWFYFRSDNVQEIERLTGLLWGIGKKTSQGYGEITSFEIEQLDFDPFEKVIRPIPFMEDEASLSLNNMQGEVRLRKTGWRPPYWDVSDFRFCQI